MAKKKFDGEVTDATAYLSGEYLKPRDLEDGPQTFGILGVSVEEFEATEHEAARQQLVLALETDPPRKLGLNKTNLGTLVAVWGKNPQRWIGRTFEAYFDASVRNPRGVKTGGVRVRVATVDEGSLEQTDAVPLEKVPF